MPEIALKKRFKYAGDVFAALMKKGWSCTEAADFVNSFRDADTEEVVRCKACKYAKPSHKGWVECTQTDTVLGDEEYCSYGERKCE